MRPRVVITGIGTVCGLGLGAEALWAGMTAGRSCLGPITRFDASGFASRLAGEVRDFSARDFVPKHYRKAVKVMARDVELAVAAAKLAVEDAGLVTRAALADEAGGAPAAAATYPAARMGCQIGAGLIAAEIDELTLAFASARSAGAPDRLDLRAWGATGMDNLTPLWLLKYLPNMLACHVTIIHGAEGPSNTITCSEASALLSIAESVRVIRRGAADLCFSGGAESKVNPMGLIRQDLAGRLAPTRGDLEPAAHVRALADEASGTVLGEGGGILVLEEACAARTRGARVYAEVAGIGAGQSHPWYAGAGDGDDPDEGYGQAVRAALDDAGVRPDQVGAIVPLASGVPEIDAAEVSTLRAVFGARLPTIPVITHCANLGNTMAGAGGIQAALGALALSRQAIPARLGPAAAGLDTGPAAARPAVLDSVLVCTGALGGQNAAVVLRRPG
ncbi:MAG TPA: beta-ketoacyl synthase N-terminal-like domain-containing protein [Phycisphaerales bacterium]|nr:beta-ketoacyl synthase N-terminal-like domain-containing protein [Phycisphaerales bacterium]